MSRLHDRLPMQLHERCFDEDARDSQSSSSVRGCRNPTVLFMFVIFTNYRERTVVAQNRVIISHGIIRIAHMVRSSLSTGIRRSATT